jgi:hypothetical protein
MKPSTAADCLAHIRGQITPTQYDEALARIEQLVAAERAIAAHEMDEAHAQRAQAALWRPLTAKEAGE